MKIQNHDLLALYRLPGNCELCAKPCKVREPAHIAARGLGDGRRLDVPINLLSLGSTVHHECQCHSKQHATGRPSRREMQEIAAKREGMEVNAIDETIWLLQRQPKPSGACEKHDLANVQVGRDYFVCLRCGERL